MIIGIIMNDAGSQVLELRLDLYLKTFQESFDEITFDRIIDEIAAADGIFD